MRANRSRAGCLSAGPRRRPPEAWAEDIARFEAADRLTPPRPGGVLFVGSSSIRLWPALEADFPSVDVLQRGFDGSELSDVVGAAAWLLDHGAEVNQRATFGGPAHGEGVTALHLAAQKGDVPMIELLLARGADRTIEDSLYRSTPAGWAEHHGFDIPALRAGRSVDGEVDPRVG